MLALNLCRFLKTVCVYFVAWLPETEKPTVFAALLKILPILSLCGFVSLQGISLEKQHNYSRRVLLGLIFSAVGDVFLVWKKHILHSWYGSFWHRSHFVYKSLWVPTTKSPCRAAVYYTRFLIVLCTLSWAEGKTGHRCPDLWFYTRWNDMACNNRCPKPD